MEGCDCGGRLVRIRRKFWQRPFYKAVYRCKDCGKVAGKRVPRTANSPYSICPRCGTGILKVRRRPDHIDSMETGIANWTRRVFGAELHHCEFCRLQFYDFRKVEGKEVRARAKPEPSSETAERSTS